jgi:hypothetical protein
MPASSPSLPLTATAIGCGIAGLFAAVVCLCALGPSVAQAPSSQWELTAEELAGGCVSCHQGVNVGGNMYQRHGIFHPLASPEPEIVRVPSLRNVAVTPPYFHDGSAATLPQAVKAMGFAQLDRVLTDDQTKAIVAFLNTLTGNYRGGPITLPGGSSQKAAPQ